MIAFDRIPDAVGIYPFDMPRKTTTLLLCHFMFFLCIFLLFHLGKEGSGGSGNEGQRFLDDERR